MIHILAVVLGLIGNDGSFCIGGHVISRTVMQDQSDLVVEYRIQVKQTGRDISGPWPYRMESDGWLYNTEVPGHGSPVRSRPKTDSLNSMAYDIMSAGDEMKLCRERMSVQIWNDSLTRPPLRVKMTAEAIEPIAVPVMSPGEIMGVRLWFAHEHFLYGPYNPLLGTRNVTLRSGPIALVDTVVYATARPVEAVERWNEPLDERKDNRHFITPPDSLILEAHIPGNQYYRFPERAVRYGTRYRLTYWYLIAPGTEGEFRVRISQYRDSQASWQVLHEGSIEDVHAIVGRWVKVERIITTQPEATSLAADFRISGGEEVGEVWVDCVDLQPVVSLKSTP